jgi:hypothetical protein
MHGRGRRIKRPILSAALLKIMHKLNIKKYLLFL